MLVAKGISFDMPFPAWNSNMAATLSEPEAAFLAFNEEFEWNG